MQQVAEFFFSFFSFLMGSKVVLIHNVSAGALKPHFESTKSCLFVFFWKIERGPLLGEQRGFIFPHGFRSCRDDRSKLELEGREFCKDNDMLLTFLLS